MGAYSSFLGSLVLLGVFKYQTVKSYNIEKSVTTLQQIFKNSSPMTLDQNGSRELSFLNGVSMNDVSNALKVVTNNSKQINQLIPKLFKVHDSNPAYVFSLPSQGTRHTFLTMHRDSFYQPVFPNLTTSYVKLMRSRGKISEYLNANNKNQFNANNLFEDRLNANLVEPEQDVPALILNLKKERNFIDFLNKVNKLGESKKDNKKLSDEWSLLGLDGWQGILSKDDEQNQHAKPNLEKDVKWDLPGQMQSKLLENSLSDAMDNSKFMTIVGNLTQRSKYPITSLRSLHSDSDVYIGRVNDPFGHSTKWNEKNSSSHTLMEDRKKRGVIELYSMIKCSTGCDPIIFKGYGCYCGFLGDGYPVDGIDRCCRLHDKCYEHSNCIPYLEYFVPYIWKCYRGKPLCAIDHGEWGGPHSCAARLCQCDLWLSRCLRRFLCPHRRAICRSSKTRMLQNILLNF